MIDEKEIYKAASAYQKEDSGKPFIEEAFRDGAEWMQQEFVKSLWHDAEEEPRKGANCILYVSCEFEENPEDNYREYTTAVYLGGGFSEDHFPSEADVYTIKWAYLDDILPEKGGEE